MSTYFWTHYNWAWCLKWVALCWISDTPTRKQIEELKADQNTEDLNMLLKSRKAPIFYSSAKDSFVTLEGAVIPPKTLMAWDEMRREFLFRPDGSF